MNIVRKASVVLIGLLLSLSAVPLARPQTQNETLLSPENAYNPIPSPDGKYIAYVRTGWGNSAGSGGFGRSNLVSQVAVIDGSGNFAVTKPLADAFLSGWTSDGAQMVCYRDGQYSLVSMDGNRSSKGRLPAATNVIGTERVSYLPRAGTVIWSRQSGFHTVLETPSGVLAQRDGWKGAMIAPSPDGKYLAIAGGWSQSHLWVYDIEQSNWADLGEASIHPDRDWDYIKPSWNPWFANSSRLAYFTRDNSVLSISAPNGKQRTDFQIDGRAGLAEPSPDGRSLAYVTFEPGPRKERSDLQFWGGTRIWVISLIRKAEPRPVTLKSPDEIYDLRWLGDHTLVFDRVADVPFYKQSRLWKVDVPPW
jgi:Tol biopolymer transport system component